jgi:sulfite exporter TauE/SafE
VRKNYAEIGAAVLIVVGGYLILKQFNLIPQGLSLNSQMSYGFVFLIGLVAAVSSCLAVTGGLLLAVAAKYNERHPDLTGFQKFKPTLYFNIGRVAGYTVLGALVGAIGSLLTLSPQVNGAVTVVASLVMIILGFQLLHLFPRLKRFQPRLPKALAHKIHDLSGRDSRWAPFVLGALTFFLPCGFTQALQLYVLSTGDAVRGGLTMLVFALGTLPALLSLSALSSYAKGSFQRYFLKTAGVVVILLGIFNIRSGLVSSGFEWKIPSFRVGTGRDLSVQEAVDPNVQMVNGVQVVNMKVSGLEYYPYRFTVQKGIPVEWRIDGSGAAGCAQVVIAPKLRITEYLTNGVKTIRFTPTQVGEIPFSCSMGMTTPGAKFVVVEGNAPQPPLKVRGGDEGGVTKCDPTVANCI